jgi:hypothetical protein
LPLWVELGCTAGENQPRPGIGQPLWTFIRGQVGPGNAPAEALSGRPPHPDCAFPSFVDPTTDLGSPSRRTRCASRRRNAGPADACRLVGFGLVVLASLVIAGGGYGPSVTVTAADGRARSGHSPRRSSVTSTVTDADARCGRLRHPGNRICVFGDIDCSHGGVRELRIDGDPAGLFDRTSSRRLDLPTRPGRRSDERTGDPSAISPDTSRAPDRAVHHGRRSEVGAASVKRRRG